MRRVLVSLLPALLLVPASAAAAPGVFDIRHAGIGLPSAPPVSAKSSAARAALKRSLGAEGVLRIDPLTGTPRVIARLDGFLSGPAAGAPEAIALGWARRHRAVLGLGRRDFSGLELIRDATAPDGTTSLVWAQTAGGVRSLDTTLRAAVSRDGRLVWIGGSPRPALNRASTTPSLTAGAALKGLRGTPLSAPKPILVNLGDRVALGWQAWLDVDSAHVYDVVVDAHSGKLLRRVNRVLSAAGSVKAWDYYPGAPRGGAATERDVSKYLTTSDRLEGDNTHVFTDTPDDDTPDPGDEIAPGLSDYASIPSPAGNCPDAGCSWNHLVPNSWETNLAQNAQQVFYFVNHFADHLRAAPVGFDAASGDFEGVDKVMANTTDGAATALVAPNPLTNALNANMLTPADGTPPRMQMYLFEPIPGLAPDFADINGGDDASVIYHEYTHGLTNRLVIGGDGNGALISPQAGAMGEAWSDFYALDFLITQGFESDTDTPGELIEGRFTDNAHNSIRTEAVDCTLGASEDQCPRVGADSDVPQTGGYAYDAFGKIIGEPEVHADGEIWVQTLFELRRALIAAHGEAEGARRALQLVTGGLRLSPDEPSYLDMRNSILQSDTLAGGPDHDLIWTVFAHRGMGYDAQSTDGFDTEPVAGFAKPPAAGAPKGSVSGTITDTDTGAPLAGVPAGISAFFSRLDSDYSALTGGDGRFTIGGVPAGQYGKVVVGGNGFEPAALGKVTVPAGGDAGGFDAKLRRNWALLDGGATVVSREGEDLGCGPGFALDANPGTGYEVDPGGPRTFVVKLPAPIDVRSLVVDPTENCNDDASSALGGYKVEFSADGSAYTTASEGTFGASDRRPNDLAFPAGAGDAVRFVRMTMKNPQGQSADPSGTTYTDYMDMTELWIYGTSRDTAAPQISFDAADAGVLRGPQATVTGTVRDDNAVTRVVSRGGAVTPDKDGRFALPVTLAKGANRITVDAYDASQNHATGTLSVLADLARPRLRRVRARRLAGGRVRVTGRVRDDTGVARLRVHGRRVKVRRHRFTVTLRAKRRVKVVAIDRAGRRTKVIRKVRRR